jgi:hypothetical protein
MENKRKNNMSQNRFENENTHPERGINKSYILLVFFLNLPPQKKTHAQ